MQKFGSSKPGTPSTIPSKNIIINWLRSLFPDIPSSVKIQDFGDGVIYCRLLNHYYSNPPHTKITWSPKNEYEYANNLKHVQFAFQSLGIQIAFEVNRISKRKFLQNWALINALYRHFNSNEELANHQQSSSIAGFSNNNSNLAQSNIINKPSLTVLKRQSSSSHEAEQKIGLKQNQNTKNIYNPQSFQQTVWDQKSQADFSNTARNSLQISQYLKQSPNLYNNSPGKGKWSVGSQMFQNNHNAVVDRVKQILLKGSHDTQKIRQIKMLLGLPLQEQQVIKIEDDIVIGPIVHNHMQEKQEKQEKQIQQPKIEESQEIKNTEQQNNKNTNKQLKNSLTKIPKKPFKI